MHAIRIDRDKPLAEQAETGHNRNHPDIEPVLEVAEGEDVVLETFDALLYRPRRRVRYPLGPVACTAWERSHRAKTVPISMPNS